MKLSNFRWNDAGQILGLPMYLVIVMIVAVAVIAAVIFMIPQGMKTLNAQVITGSAHTGIIQDDGSVNFSDFNVAISVITNDDRRDPIVDATVRIVGGGVVAEGITNAQGQANLAISGATLNVGVNEAYMKMTVKASGYEDFNDDEAVLLYRG